MAGLVTSIFSWLWLILWPAVVLWQLLTGKALGGEFRRIYVAYRRSTNPGRYWSSVIAQTLWMLAYVAVAIYYHTRKPGHHIL